VHAGLHGDTSVLLEESTHTGSYTPSAAAMSNPTPASSMPLRYATWISDVELGFYSSLASIKINHDRLDSSARKVLGLYEINPKDAEARSTRMQIHGNALTTDE
jgi:hypothetical protein